MSMGASAAESGSPPFVDDVAAARRNQVNSEAHWSLSTSTAKLRLTLAGSASGFAGCKSTLKSLGIKLDVISGTVVASFKVADDNVIRGKTSQCSY